MGDYSRSRNTPTRVDIDGVKYRAINKAPIDPLTIKDSLCSALTAGGYRCCRLALAGTEFCGLHRRGAKYGTVEDARRLFNDGVDDPVMLVPLIAGYGDDFDEGQSFDITESDVNPESPEEEANLIAFFNGHRREISAAVAVIDGELPAEFNEVGGGFANIVARSAFGNTAAQERGMFDLWLEGSSVRGNRRVTNLAKPHEILYRGTMLEKQKKETFASMLNGQEKILKFSENAAAELEILIPSDIELSEDFITDMTPEQLQQLYGIVGNYTEDFLKLRHGDNGYLYGDYDHDEVFRQKFDVMSDAGKRTIGLAHAEILHEDLVDDEEERYELMTLITTLRENLQRDHTRAERFITERNIWFNDNSGAVYSPDIAGGSIKVPTANIVKMAVITAARKQGRTSGDASDIFREHPELVTQEIGGILLHEYGHHVHHAKARTRLEHGTVNFAAVGEDFDQIARLGLANKLAEAVHLRCGGYTKASPAELFCEFLRFHYTSTPQEREMTRGRFHNKGFDDIYDNLVGLVAG